MSVFDNSTKGILFSQVSKKVSTSIGNWVQTLYPDIQCPTCPWCHTKGVELHRCHVGPRKVDIIRAEMDVLWKLSTAMGQVPKMDTFVLRVTDRVKQDHNDGFTRIEIACGACNPYFEEMQLAKLIELNRFSGRDRKTMRNMYKKRIDNPNPVKRRRVEPTITRYFRRPHDADNEDDEEEESASDGFESDESDSEESDESDSEESDESDSYINHINNRTNKIQCMRQAIERFQGPLHPNNRFKGNAKWLVGQLKKETERKGIHTTTLKQIYSLVHGGPARGQMANDRVWLQQSIQEYEI